MRDADKGQTWQQMQDELVHPCGGEAKLTDGELLELYKLAVKTIIDLKSKLATAHAEALLERTAQIAAHRVCCGVEHDPANGKLHGYCVVCGVPWPCEYASTPPASSQRALRILYEEISDYIRINNLGDVHHNRSMQFARDVLAAHPAVICTYCQSVCEEKFNNGNGAWVCIVCRRMQ